MMAEEALAANWNDAGIRGDGNIRIWVEMADKANRETYTMSMLAAKLFMCTTLQRRLNRMVQSKQKKFTEF